MNVITLTSGINGQPLLVVAEQVTHVEQARGDQADVYLSSGAVVRVSEPVEAVRQALAGRSAVKDDEPPAPAKRERK